VLFKDERIRYRRSERDALVKHGVKAFCLTGGNLRAQEMAELFAGSLDEMAAACASPGPFLYAVSRQGMRRVV
jgi:hypothetical protein